MTNIATNNIFKQTVKIVFLTILTYLIILIILIYFSSSNGGYGIFNLIQPLYCEGLVEINLKKEDLSFITEGSLEKEWVSKLKLTHEEILRPIRNNMCLNNYKVVDLGNNQLTKLSEWWPAEGIKILVEFKTNIEQNTGIQETINLLDSLNEKRSNKIVSESIKPVAESIRNFGETPRSSHWRSPSWVTTNTLTLKTEYLKHQFALNKNAGGLSLNTELNNSISNMNIPQTAKTYQFSINEQSFSSTVSMENVKNIRSERLTSLLDKFILDNINHESDKSIWIDSEYSCNTQKPVEPLRYINTDKELPPIPNEESSSESNLNSDYPSSISETNSQCSRRTINTKNLSLSLNRTSASLYSRGTSSWKDLEINWRGTVGSSIESES